jgi:serine/threonine protein kinase
MSRPKAASAAVAAKTEFKAECENMYQYVPDGPEYRNPHPEMPQHPFRIGICGSSGAGKTNLAVNIIKKSECFDEVWIFANAEPNQPLYKLLAKCKGVKVFTGLDDLPLLDELKSAKKTQRLFIFDDYITLTELQHKPIIEYFVASRHKNCSCIYLAQDYIQIPKLIRRNLTQLFLKNIESEDSLKHIVRQYARGVTLPVLTAMYRDAMKHNSFLQIDMAAKNTEDRFRLGFGEAYEI